MAIYFKDSDALQCKDCGARILSSRTVGTYAPSEKEEGTMIFTPTRQEIYCSSCGKVVLAMDISEKIKRSGDT